MKSKEKPLTEGFFNTSRVFKEFYSALKSKRNKTYILRFQENFSIFTVH